MLPRGAAARFEPLDAALRLHNVDIAALTSGAAAALQLGGETYGLPLTQLPWGVRWRTDVFTAAGIAPPAPGWTLSEFETVCMQLQGFAATGRAPQISSALGPFVAEYGMPLSPWFTYWTPTALEAPGLWPAFAIGFGGTIASGGRFDVTGSATLQGLGHLVDPARRFGAPGPFKAGAPTPAVLSGCPADAGTYGMWFAPYVPPLRFEPARPVVHHVDCARCRWARLPRFPVTAVIPTVASGLGLAWKPPSGAATKAPPLPPAASVGPYADATAAFLVWLYGTQAQALLRAAGFIPVSDLAAVRSAFWADAAGDLRALGDYAHFADHAAGWPSVPPTDWVGQALARAVTAPADPASLLASAEQQSNAWLVQQAHAGGAATS